MEIQLSITALRNQGWSERRIARELGIHRQTVKRYVSDSKCTNAYTGKKGPVSQCETHRDRIKEAYQSGLSIERIHQDLTLNHAFTGSYHSIRRFVKSLEVDEPNRVHRMECDLDLQTRTLRVVQGKGRKDRQVPVGKVAAQFLGEYVKQVRPVLLKKVRKPNGALFLIRTEVLRARFQKHRDGAGLGDIYTVHSLRHSCATEMLRGGASVRHVQELLGHNSIDTTQVYTRVVIDDLQRSHSRTALGNRRQESAFTPFNRKTATWRQEKKRKQ